MKTPAVADLMTPAVAAMRIDRQLKAVETHFDRLLSEHASLAALLAQARLEVDEPFGNGQLALGRMSKSYEALIGSRGDLARVHGELERIAVERGDIMLTPKPANGSLEIVGAGDEEAAVAA